MMHRISTRLLICSFTTFCFACQEPVGKEVINQPLSNTGSIPQPFSSISQSVDEMPPAREEKTFSEVKSIPLKTRSRMLHVELQKDSTSGEEALKYTIRDHVIDSLNAIVPLFDREKYDQLTVSYFSALATSLHGVPFYAENPDSMMSSIIEILTTRLNEGTDIVFLVDKTGSMTDDIDKVRESLSTIMDYLSRYSGVKVGMAFYGDKNYHYGLWYNKVNLTTDIDSIRRFMGRYSTIGNADIPESVNDAIVETVKTMNWTPGHRRMMLVIGDAYSQMPPLSAYNASQVVHTCDSMQVRFNLYPIVLATTHNARMETYEKKEFVKLFPNPADAFCNLQFNEQGKYNVEINDMTGRIIYTTKIYEATPQISLGNMPSGSYLIQVYNDDVSRYYSTPLVVRH